MIGLKITLAGFILLLFFCAFVKLVKCSNYPTDRFNFVVGLGFVSSSSLIVGGLITAVFVL